MRYKPCFNEYNGIKEVIKLYNRNIKRSQSFLYNVLDITLSSASKEVSIPSLLNNTPLEDLQKNSPRKSLILLKQKILNAKKYHQAALNHLKFQILTEIKNDLKKALQHHYSYQDE